MEENKSKLNLDLQLTDSSKLHHNQSEFNSVKSISNHRKGAIYPYSKEISLKKSRKDQTPRNLAGHNQSSKALLNELDVQSVLSVSPRSKNNRKQSQTLVRKHSKSLFHHKSKSSILAHNKKKRDYSQPGVVDFSSQNKRPHPLYFHKSSQNTIKNQLRKMEIQENRIIQDWETIQFNEQQTGWNLFGDLITTKTRKSRVWMLVDKINKVKQQYRNIINQSNENTKVSKRVKRPVQQTESNSSRLKILRFQDQQNESPLIKKQESFSRQTQIPQAKIKLNTLKNDLNQLDSQYKQFSGNVKSLMNAFKNDGKKKKTFQAQSCVSSPKRQFEDNDRTGKNNSSSPHRKSIDLQLNNETIQVRKAEYHETLLSYQLNHQNVLNSAGNQTTQEFINQLRKKATLVLKPESPMGDLWSQDQSSTTKNKITLGQLNDFDYQIMQLTNKLKDDAQKALQLQSDNEPLVLKARLDEVSFSNKREEEQSVKSGFKAMLDLPAFQRRRSILPQIDSEKDLNINETIKPQKKRSIVRNNIDHLESLVTKHFPTQSLTNNSSTRASKQQYLNEILEEINKRKAAEFKIAVVQRRRGSTPLDDSSNFTTKRTGNLKISNRALFIIRMREKFQRQNQQVIKSNAQNKPVSNNLLNVNHSQISDKSKFSSVALSQTMTNNFIQKLCCRRALASSQHTSPSRISQVSSMDKKRTDAITNTFNNPNDIIAEIDHFSAEFSTYQHHQREEREHIIYGSQFSFDQ